MLAINPIKRRDRSLLLLILFIAALLRFGEPGVVEFFHDDAMLSTLAQNMVDGEGIPLTGILSSVGIPNPPISVYVMAIPFALSGNPMVAILFVMALNVIGVGLLWLIAQRYFGRTVALIAGLAYAVNPWALLYSRKIWAQDYHTPFILLAILLGLYGFWEAKPHHELDERRFLNKHEWAQALCLPVMLFAMQIHFAAWTLLPLYGVLLWIGRKRVSFRAIAVSIAFSIVVMLPYAAGLANTLSQDPTRISDAMARSDASSGLSLSVDALRDGAYLATGLGMETWLQPADPDALITQVPTLPPFWILIGIAALVGFVALVQQHPYFLALMITWVVIPLVAFMPTWTPVYPHYFIPIIPAFTLLTGFGVNWIGDKLPARPQSKSILLALAGMLFITQGLWWRGVLRYLDITEIAYPGFTTPLHYLETVRQSVSTYNDVIIISHGMSWELHHESAIWPVMLHDSAECVRTIVPDGYAVFPDHPFAVVEAPEAPDGFAQGLYITNDARTFPTRPDGGKYRLSIWETAPEWNGPDIQPIDIAAFDSGVQLTGYALDSARMIFEWQLPGQRKGLNYQYSGQFLNAAGSRIAQQDTVFWQGRHWCAGDRLLTWASIDIPQGAKTLRVSLYTLGTGRDTGQYFSANVLDALGNPAGQWVDIPLD